MINEFSVKFTIEDNDSDLETLNDQVALLRSNLENFDLQIVNGPTEQSVGTKGDPITAGVIILTLSPVVLEQAFTFIQQWVIDKRKISVEAPNGAKIEFTPDKKYSEKELIDLVKKLNAIE